MSDERRAHREYLLRAEQKAQEDFDKAVMALAGGALGVSIAFVRDFLGPAPYRQVVLLLTAWICWAASLAAVLTSYYFSHLALRRAIDQFDSGKPTSERVGGVFDLVIVVLNPAGGVMLILGVVLLAVFVVLNLGG